MDAPWREDSVLPSVMDWETRFEKLDPIQLKNWRKELLSDGQRLSEELLKLPYEPPIWLWRGIVLSDLGFPELALGDVFKCILLCDSLICDSPLIHWISAKVPERWQENIDAVELRLLRMEALIEWFKIMRNAKCFRDCIDIAEKIKLQATEDCVIEMLDDQLEITECLFEVWLKKWGVQGSSTQHDSIPSRHGFIHRRNYPWMPVEAMSRSKETIAKIQQELDVATSESLHKRLQDEENASKIDSQPETTCSVRLSGQTNESCHTEDIAIFAERDIQVGEAIIIDSQRMIAASIPGQEASSYTDLIPELITRSMTEQTSDFHPLKDIILSRWKPETRQNTAPLIPFSFQEHVEKPLVAIMELDFEESQTSIVSTMSDKDIDVFCDDRLDTWVLQQLGNRISMNHQVVHLHPTPNQTVSELKAGTEKLNGNEEQSSNQTALILGQLLPLFNHSCESNLRTEYTREGIRLIAKRNIRKGDELCVSYIRPGLCYNERTIDLRPWFDECRCPLCDQDRKATLSKGLAVRLYRMVVKSWKTFQSTITHYVQLGLPIIPVGTWLGINGQWNAIVRMQWWKQRSGLWRTFKLFE